MIKLSSNSNKILYDKGIKDCGITLFYVAQTLKEIVRYAK